MHINAPLLPPPATAHAHSSCSHAPTLQQCLFAVAKLHHRLAAAAPSCTFAAESLGDDLHTHTCHMSHATCHTSTVYSCDPCSTPKQTHLKSGRSPILTFIAMFWLTVQALPPHQQLSWQWLRKKFSCDHAKPIFSTRNTARGKRCITAQASVTCHITPHAPKLLAVREWNYFLAMNGRRQQALAVTLARLRTGGCGSLCRCRTARPAAAAGHPKPKQRL